MPEKDDMNPGGVSKYCQCDASVSGPKVRVPRPRNAFILFRQHQHGLIAKDFPGKTNPELSKIIGEQWRGLSLRDREYWVQKSDEEKKLHHERFPDYRYQPRRSKREDASGDNLNSGSNGQGSSQTNSAGSDANIMCLNCHKMRRKDGSRSPFRKASLNSNASSGASSPSNNNSNNNPATRPVHHSPPYSESFIFSNQMPNASSKLSSQLGTQSTLDFRESGPPAGPGPGGGQSAPRFSVTSSTSSSTSIESASAFSTSSVILPPILPRPEEEFMLHRKMSSPASSFETNSTNQAPQFTRHGSISRLSSSYPQNTSAEWFRRTNQYANTSPGNGSTGVVNTPPTTEASLSSTPMTLSPPMKPNPSLLPQEKAQYLHQRHQRFMTPGQIIAVESKDHKLIEWLVGILAQGQLPVCDTQLTETLMGRRPPFLQSTQAVHMYKLSCMLQLVHGGLKLPRAPGEYSVIGGYMLGIADDLFGFEASEAAGPFGLRPSTSVEEATQRWKNGVSLLQGLRVPDWTIFIEHDAEAIDMIQMCQLTGGTASAQFVYVNTRMPSPELGQQLVQLIINHKPHS